MSLIKLASKRVTQAEMDAANAEALKTRPWEIHPQDESGIKPKVTIPSAAPSAAPKVETKKSVKKLLTSRKVGGLIGAVGLAAAAYGLHRHLKHKKSEGKK
jgi:hypothetical protein